MAEVAPKNDSGAATELKDLVNKSVDSFSNESESKSELEVEQRDSGDCWLDAQ